MNRRHLLNRAVCFMPGATMLQSHAQASFPFLETFLSAPETQAAENILNPQDNKVMLDLLRICLERIHWHGDVSQWRTRLFQVIDQIQALIERQGPESEALLMTAHQMDVTTDLCRGAETGSKENIIERALRFCDAFDLHLS